MIMGRCRACRRIAARKKKLGYWRPFVIFSIAVHLCATAAFSQLSMTDRGPVRDTDYSFVQLVKLPQGHARAGAEKNKTAHPAPGAARKRSTRNSENKTAKRAASTRNNNVALKERPEPSMIDKEKLAAAVASPEEEENKSDQASDAAPKGIVIIRGDEKEVVMPVAPEAAPETSPAAVPSAAGNIPVIKIPAEDDIQPLSGHSISSAYPEEDDTTQAPYAMREAEQEKINLANNENFQAEDSEAVPEPVFSKADLTGFAAPNTLAVELPIELPVTLPMKSPMPPNVEPGIKIVRPSGAFTDESTLEVTGIVSGEGINSVDLLVNDMLWETPVQDGIFKERVLLKEGENDIKAVVSDASGRKAEDSITVTYRPTDIVVRFTCPQDCKLAYKWAPHPLGIGTGSPSPDEINIKEDTGAAVFSVRHAVPGIYTVLLGNDASEAEEVSFEAVLYGYDTAKHKARSYGPLKIQAKGELAAVKVLMPEGIFWDEDSWFSGIIRDGSVTTKYKMPEGIVWKEEE
jgi:Glucodextranase, domain B